MTSEAVDDQDKKGQSRKPPLCPVSHSTDVQVFLEIPSVPVHCNLLWTSRNEALHAPRGRIKLAFSPRSGHVWNVAFDPQLMEYTQQYENSLHFSPRFQSYAHGLAARLIEQHTLRNKAIVEIGSGKGEFLRMLCEQGNNRGVGFDPSYVPEADGAGSAEQVQFVQDMYSERYADYTADFICCRHVLEHIQFPADMLLTVRKAIGNRHNTVVFFEVPNALFTLRDLSIWDIIYEHCSYFSAGSLTYLFKECGFEPIQTGEEFGGQFLTITALPASSDLETPTGAWDDLDEMAADVAVFASHYRQKVDEWTQRLEQMAAAGKKMVVWGVGSKGVMFLNTLPSRDKIAYVVDINPRKRGMYVAGSGQQIVPPEFLSDYQPDTVIIMNPIYMQEIQQTIAGLGIKAELLAV